MQRYYSQSGFAKFNGITHQAVSAAIKDNRVVKTGRGIDPTHPTNLHFVEKLKDSPRIKGMKAQQEERDELEALISGDTSLQQEQKDIPDQVEEHKVIIAAGAKRLNSKSKKKRQITQEDLLENFNPDEIKADIHALTKQSVDKLKVVEQIKALQLKTEERKQQLVPRDLVRRVLGKLYQIDVNELRTLPDKLASDIAAECKIDDTDIIFAINKIIEKEIYKTLEHMKRLLNDFLIGIKAERIK